MLYVLLLNDMRAANVENIQPVAWSENQDSLVEYCKQYLVEPYGDPKPSHYGPQSWHKVFRRDSPLEWKNPPSALGGITGGIMPIEASVVYGVPMYDPRPVRELDGVIKV